MPLMPLIGGDISMRRRRCEKCEPNKPIRPQSLKRRPRYGVSRASCQRVDVNLSLKVRNTNSSGISTMLIYRVCIASL